MSANVDPPAVSSTHAGLTMTADTATISPTASFEELSRRVRQAGLTDFRDHGHVLMPALTLLLIAAGWTALVLTGDSWWQLALAVVLPFTVIQAAYIGHDTGHKQISRSRGASELIGLIYWNLFQGISHGWWVSNHNRHHKDPNHLDRDPDGARKMAAGLTPEELARRRHPVRRFVVTHPRLFFWVLLAKESYRLRRAGVVYARSGKMKRPVIELGLMAVHLAGYATVVFLVMSPPVAVAFLVVNQIVYGLLLGGSFAPNHKGMVVYRDDVELDWLHRQVLTARNIRCNRVVDFFFGGVNHQIEHHLFPAMPRANLRRAQPIVRQYCAEHGVPYHETGFFESYREVARYAAELSGRTVATLRRAAETRLPDQRRARA
jgi:fatty acid desaturase